jgi:LPS-assembly lipoprotein
VAPRIFLKAWLSAALALVAASLGGCGFTPLYATPNLSPGLATIDVIATQGRVGYLLREDLDDALGHDKSAASAWRLDMTVDQTRGPRGLTLTDVAERYIVGVSVRYSLTDVATGKVVHSGRVASHVSYDEANDPYAGIAARQDSQERAASDAARQIQLDLATWMNARAKR